MIDGDNDDEDNDDVDDPEDGYPDPVHDSQELWLTFLASTNLHLVL